MSLALTSNFLSFIVVEHIRFFHSALHLIVYGDWFCHCMLLYASVTTKLTDV